MENMYKDLFNSFLENGLPYESSHVTTCVVIGVILVVAVLTIYYLIFALITLIMRPRYYIVWFDDQTCISLYCSYNKITKRFLEKKYKKEVYLVYRYESKYDMLADMIHDNVCSNVMVDTKCVYRKKVEPNYILTAEEIAYLNERRKQNEK